MLVDRLAHVGPAFRVAVVAISALGVLGLGVVLATGAMRGDAAAPTHSCASPPWRRG